MHSIQVLRRFTACTLMVATAAAMSPAYAGRDPSGASELSALSMLPVAIPVGSAALALSGTATLAVVAVQASAEGVVWIVERASDGARITLRFARDVAGGLSLVAGEAITVVAMGTGWLLCTAGKAIAFVPNEAGASLLYSARIPR